MKELPNWKKKTCEQCEYYEVCLIDHDCEAMKVLEWLYEDICDDNPEIGDW